MQGFINVTNSSLDISSLNISDRSCEETFITIRPVVEFNSTVLANVFINVTSCGLSNLTSMWKYFIMLIYENMFSNIDYQHTLY